MLTMLLLGCALGSSSPETVPVTSSDLLDQIARLGANTPFTSSQVESVLGTKLEQTSDTKYFTILKGEAPPAWTAITVMVPKPGAAKGGSVALEATGQPCVTSEAARQRFGFAHASPSPPGPPDPYERYQHQLSWGTLILGYDHDTRCLREATLRAR
jgi:hypothetical protein